MMEEEYVRPASKWELPTVFLIAGLIILSIGLSFKTNWVSIGGLIIIIVSATQIIKIRDRNIEEPIKDENPLSDTERLDWKNHHGER